VGGGDGGEAFTDLTPPRFRGPVAPMFEGHAWIFAKNC